MSKFQYKWVSYGQNAVWTWFSLDTNRGVYEVIPNLFSSLNGQETYFYEVTFKGKFIGSTDAFPKSKIKKGRAAGRILAQKHFEDLSSV